MKALLFSLLLLLPLLQLQAQKTNPAVSVLVKQHSDLTKSFEERPYGDGDTSFGLFVDLFDGMGGWRLGASYASGLSGPGEADTVITPEVTLMAVDKMFEAGVSLLIDYIDTEEGTDWGDLYFQTSIGLNFNLGSRMSLGIHAYYPFEDYSGFFDFDFDEIEYGGQFRFIF